MQKKDYSKLAVNLDKYTSDALSVAFGKMLEIWVRPFFFGKRYTGPYKQHLFELLNGKLRPKSTWYPAERLENCWLHLSGKNFALVQYERIWVKTDSTSTIPSWKLLWQLCYMAASEGFAWSLILSGKSKSGSWWPLAPGVSFLQSGASPHTLGDMSSAYRSVWCRNWIFQNLKSPIGKC